MSFDSAKIGGIIPKDKYVHYTYLLLLASAAIGLVVSLLAVLGIMAGGLGGLAGLAALAGVILALLGIFVFKDDLSEFDRSHLIYVAVLYVGLWFVCMFFSSALAFIPLLSSLAVLALSVAGAVLIYAGYNSFKAGRTITKNNLKDEVQLALKRG
jgi:hypothetical protein